MPSGENITTKFKVDVSDLKAGISEANKQIKLANAEFKAASAGMDDWSKSADGITAKLKQLDSVLASQKAKYDSYKQQLDRQQQAYDENGKKAEELKAKLKELADNGVAKTSDEYKRYQKALSEVEKEQQNNKTAIDNLKVTLLNQEAAVKSTEAEIKSYTKTLDDLDKGLEGANDSAKDASGGFTVMKGALASLVAEGIRTAINALKEFISDTLEAGQAFEKSMSSVAALSGATAEEFELLKETAKEYGSTTQFSASQAADALGYMALAGWNAQQSVDALGGVLDLAAASGMDLAKASDMVTDYMSAFGMSADKSAYFADLLAYAQANANTTVQGLGEAFQNSAANMNAAGQDIETVTSLLAMMANQGLKGSRAGTALSAVMRDITKNINDDAIAIGNQKVAVMDVSGNFRDLTDILKDVEAATVGMGDAEKAVALQSTFTADSIKGLNLILNAGTAEAEQFEEKLRNSTGSAKEMAKVMQDNLSGDMTAFKSKVEGVQIALYEKLEPALRAGVKILNGLIDALGWVIKNGGTIISVIKTLAAALGAYFAYNAAIKVMESGWLALTVAQKAVTAYQWAMNAAMSANPIGLVVAATVALVAVFAKLKKSYDENVEANSEMIQGAKALKSEAEQCAADLDKMADSMKNLNSTAHENVNEIEAEAKANSALADELYALAGQTNQTAREKERMQYIVETLNGAYEGLNLAIDSETGSLNMSRDAIDDVINKKYELAKANAIQELYTEQLKETYALEAEMAAVYDKRKKAQDELNSIMDSGTLIESEWAGQHIVQIKYTKEQKTAIATLQDTIEEYDRTLQDSQKVIIDSYDELEAFAKMNGETIPASLQRAKNDAEDYFRGLRRGAKEVTSEVQKEGENFSLGYAKGIKAKVREVKDAAREVVRAAKEALAAAQRSASPAKEVIPFGEYFTEGYAVGIEKAVGKATTAAKTVVQTVKDYFATLITDSRSELQKVVDKMNEPLLESEQRYKDESLRLEKEYADEKKRLEQEEKDADEFYKDEQKRLSKEENKDQREANNEYLENLRDANTAKKEANRDYLQSVSDTNKAYLDGLKETAETERKIYDARVKDAETAKKKIVDTFNAMAEDVFGNVDELKKLQDDFVKKLDATTSLVQKVTITDKNGTEEYYKLADISAQTKELEDFYDLLMKVKNRGNVPAEFFDMLRNMSVEEATRTATALLSVSDEEFNQFFEDWQKQRETEAKISKAVYADEVSDIVKDVNNQFYTIADNFLAIGESSADEFENGFTQKLRGVLERVKLQINAALGSVMPDDTVSVGGWKSALTGSVANIQSGAALATAAAGGVTNTNNFTQIINAPTAPSRLDVYRQTKNLLSLLKGSGN